MRSIEAIPPLEMCTALALAVELTVFKMVLPSARRQDVVAPWHSKPPPESEPLFHTPMIESAKNVESKVRSAPDSTSNPPRESEIIA